MGRHLSKTWVRLTHVPNVWKTPFSFPSRLNRLCGGHDSMVNKDTGRHTPKKTIKFKYYKLHSRIMCHSLINYIRIYIYFKYTPVSLLCCFLAGKNSQHIHNVTINTGLQSNRTILHKTFVYHCVGMWGVCGWWLAGLTHSLCYYIVV